MHPGGEAQAVERGGERLFTRAGGFRPDAAGNLVSVEGDLLLGVQADAGLHDDYRALVAARGRAALRKWLVAAWRKRIEIELADALRGRGIIVQGGH